MICTLLTLLLNKVNPLQKQLLAAVVATAKQVAQKFEQRENLQAPSFADCM